MPPSRSHIRAAIEAYLVRHPDEQPRLDALLAALGRSDSPTPRGTFPGHASCSALLKKPANASALIYNDAGQYLLHLRDNIPGIWEPGAWSLLGGGREPEDRSLDDTVHRELHEEAGLFLPELEPYAIEEAPTGGGSTVDIAIYAGRWNGDPGELALTEGVMLAWFTPSVLPRLRISPTTIDLVQRHSANQAAAPARTRPDPDLTGRSTDRPAGGTPQKTVPHIVGVHLYLEDERGNVLLGQRHPNSTYAPSTHHFLNGYCERESAISCLVREAHDEAGLTIAPQDVALVHVIHLKDAPRNRPARAPVLPSLQRPRDSGSPRSRQVHQVALVARRRTP